ALKVATGTYITGHDSDDWAHPSRLENHMTAIKENGFPKASITRMIRMDKTGFFSHIGKEGAFSVDGVMRIASITCMFESDFLKKNLGGWDSVRFGADSEIIARATKILGKNFKNFEQISMICLDAEGSLTNDPIHGVSKETGISPTRKEYRDAWMAWHETLDTNNMYLEFPHQKRKFAVPNAAFVSTEDINANLETMILSN
ncbi:glycosyltransferase family 2 protein, partial [Acinetobacter soli]|uniref:glycosyltransferase family 2 protein n=1 Tax=Acinetobacter soli TaxID=487316 RepID=UPI001C0924BC